MSGKAANPIAVGKIRLDVPKLAELKTFVQSPVVYIANCRGMTLEVEKIGTSKMNPFSVYVYCNEADQNPHWSCEASVVLNLLSQKVGQKTHSRGPYINCYPLAINRQTKPSDAHGLAFVYTFCTSDDFEGYPSFIKNDKLLDPANGYIREEDGGAVFEATITVTKVLGLPVSILCDFSAPHPNHTDVALIVEEKPVHVVKMYLAYHSPVFDSMLFSDFAEKSKKEIPLPDVKYDEFVELLHVILPSRKPVTVATVDGLLRLADRFSMQVVLHSCEEFLRGPDSEEIPLAKKLLWSDQYRLASLQSVCLNMLKSIDDVNVLKGKKEYDDLSDKTKAALGERILELTMS